MIEARDLLAPGATLLAVALAVFAFALPRALEIGRKKRAALLEADIPDSVKKQNKFLWFVFGDSITLFMASILSLMIGVGFVIFMHDTLKLYLDSPLLTIDRVLEEFRFLLFMLFGALIVLFVGSLTLFTTEVIIGEKNLPLLARVYARGVLGRWPSKVDTDSLVPEARNLYKKGAFGESVLYSTASLETALKSRFNLPINLNFGRAIVELKEQLGKIVPVEELNNIRVIRNIAAHPSPERKVTKKDAEQALRLVEKILKRLEKNYQERVE